MLGQDLLFTLRSLLKRPSYAVVVVLTLALGISATTVIYSITNALFLRQIPYEDPGRLLVLTTANPAQGQAQNTASYPEFADWRSQSQAFVGLAAFSFGHDFNLTERDQPVAVQVSFVSANYFDILGTEAYLGRTFLPEEDTTPGGHPVALLSYSLWKSRFGGAEAVIDRTIQLNNQTFTVVGVLPQGFQDLAFQSKPDIWLPVMMSSTAVNPVRLESRMARWLNVVGRVKPRITPEQARTELTTVADRLAQQYPDASGGFIINAQKVEDFFFGADKLRQRVLMLALGALFVLVIACVNVANLSLTRTGARSREIATRLAMGSSRGQLIRQLLMEALALSILGGILGVLLANYAIHILVALNPLSLPSYVTIDIDATVMLVTMVTVVLTALGFGLAPALKGARVDLRDALSEGGRASSSSKRRAILRNAMVIGEIATAVVLLICAGLLIRSFQTFQNQSIGFNTDRLLLMKVQLPVAKYSVISMRQNFYWDFLDAVDGLPGLESAGLWGSGLPGDNPWYQELLPDHQPENKPENRILSYEHRISAGAIEALGIPLVYGRDFNTQDIAGAPEVAILSEATARSLFPGVDLPDVLGRRFKRMSNPAGLTPDFTVVGIVKDVLHRGRNQPEDVQDHYVPIIQVTTSRVGIFARAERNPAVIAGALREILRDLDSSLPLIDVRTMDQRLRDEESTSRFYAVLMGAFAVVAVALALLGIYGVLVYTVSQRTYELGLRMALGASRKDVILMVGRQAMLLIFGGMGVGLVLSFVATQVLSSLLYGVTLTDLRTYLGVPLLLALAGLLASYLPAKRATEIEPVVAMRYD